MIVRDRSFASDLDPASLAGRPDAFARFWQVAYCALVGGSERFIIRSCAPWLGRATPALRARLKLCFGQEANHALTHDHFLRSAGAEMPGLRAVARWNAFVCFRLLEPLFPSRFRLASAAAMEQLNTAIALSGIRAPAIPPGESELGRMLLWHYVEEIEHREVVFDLMEEAGAGFLLRLSAMALVFGSFAFWITFGAVLAALPQGGGLKGSSRLLWGEGAVFPGMIASAARFCRPGYHPREDLLPPGFAELAERV